MYDDTSPKHLVRAKLKKCEHSYGKLFRLGRLRQGCIQLLIHIITCIVGLLYSKYQDVLRLNLLGKIEDSGSCKGEIVRQLALG